MTKYDDIKKAVFSVEHKADPYAENDITTIVQDYKELLGELRTTMNIITDAINLFIYSACKVHIAIQPS
jgi:hypothetical protein